MEVPRGYIDGPNGDGNKHVSRSLIRAAAIVFAHFIFGFLIVKIDGCGIHRRHEKKSATGIKGSGPPIGGSPGGGPNNSAGTGRVRIRAHDGVAVRSKTIRPGLLSEWLGKEKLASAAIQCVEETVSIGLKQSWEDFARQAGIAESDFGSQASRVDPEGHGPRLYFQRVPEGKTAKNRVHLDVQVAGRGVHGEHRKRLVSEHVERLVRAGASVAWETDDVRGSAIVMYDPEGNEFCVT